MATIWRVPRPSSEQAFAKLILVIPLLFPSMPMFPGRKAMRLCCAALLAFCLTPVSASAAEVPGQDSVHLDQQLQALKEDFTAFRQRVLLSEDEVLYPPVSRVTVFVSNNIPELMLQNFRVAIDGTQPAVHQYDESQARALLFPDTVQKLMRVNMPRGGHRMRAQFTARMINDEQGAEPVTGEAVFTFRKGVEAVDLEIQIVQGPSRARPALLLQEWRPVE